MTAAQMAVEDFGGKVLGAPVEVIFADHQNKPDIAANTAREWFDTKQVDAVTSKTDTCARGAPHAFSAATVVFVGEQRMAAATERRWARHDTLSRFDRLDLPSAAGLRTETYRDEPRARVSTASGNLGPF